MRISHAEAAEGTEGGIVYGEENGGAEVPKADSMTGAEARQRKPRYKEYKEVRHAQNFAKKLG